MATEVVEKKARLPKDIVEQAVDDAQAEAERGWVNDKPNGFGSIYNVLGSV